MNGAIEAVLCLRGPDQDMMQEVDFAARKADVAAALAEPSGGYGEVRVRGGGQPEIVLSDDLPDLASALTAGVRQLQRGEGAEIASFGEPFKWMLERRGGHITTRATRPGGPPSPEPQAEDAEPADTSGAVLDRSFYAPREDRREDDASAFTAALQGAAERLLDLLEGGGRFARLVAESRDTLAGKPPPAPPGGPPE